MFLKSALFTWMQFSSSELSYCWIGLWFTDSLRFAVYLIFALQDTQNQKLKTSIWYREVNDYFFSFYACWTPEIDLLKNVIIWKNRYYPFFSFFGCTMWCVGVLVPWPGIKLMPPAVKALSLNHWIASEVPGINIIFPFKFPYICSRPDLLDSE